MNFYNFFAPILKPYKWWIALCLQASFLGSFYNFIYFYAIKIILDKAILIVNHQQNIPWQEFIMPVFIFIFAEIFINAIWRLSNYGYIKSQPMIQKDVLIKGYNYIINHSYNFFINNNSGAIISKLRKLTDCYFDIFISFQHGFFCYLVQSIINIIILLFIDYKMGLIFISWFVIAFPIMAIMSKKSAELSTIESEEKHKIIGLIGDNIININNLSLFAKKEIEEQKLQNQITKKVIPIEIKAAFYYFKMHIICGLIYIIMLLAVATATIYLCYQHKITAGTVTLIFGMALSVMEKSWCAVKEYANFIKQVANMKSAFSIIQTTQNLLDKPQAKQLIIS